MKLVNNYLKIVNFFSNHPQRYEWVHYVLLFGLPYNKLKKMLSFGNNERVLDIGCGPAQILKHIKKPALYVGVDENMNHINNLRKKFTKTENHFAFCGRVQDVISENKFNKFTKIFMLGLMHHLDDRTLENLVIFCKENLEEEGELITFDPVLTKYNIVSNVLCYLDQGRFVRNESDYRKFLKNSFNHVQSFSLYPRTGILKFHVAICGKK